MIDLITFLHQYVFGKNRSFGKLAQFFPDMAKVRKGLLLSLSLSLFLFPFRMSLREEIYVVRFFRVARRFSLRHKRCFSFAITSLN